MLIYELAHELDVTTRELMDVLESEFEVKVLNPDDGVNDDLMAWLKVYYSDLSWEDHAPASFDETPIIPVYQLAHDLDVPISELIDTLESEYGIPTFDPQEGVPEPIAEEVGSYYAREGSPAQSTAEEGGGETEAATGNEIPLYEIGYELEVTTEELIETLASEFDLEVEDLDETLDPEVVRDLREHYGIQSPEEEAEAGEGDDVAEDAEGDDVAGEAEDAADAEDEGAEASSEEDGDGTPVYELAYDLEVTSEELQSTLASEFDVEVGDLDDTVPRGVVEELASYYEEREEVSGNGAPPSGGAATATKERDERATAVEEGDEVPDEAEVDEAEDAEDDVEADAEEEADADTDEEAAEGDGVPDEADGDEPEAEGDGVPEDAQEEAQDTADEAEVDVDEGDGVPEEAEDAEDEGDEDAQEEAEDAEEAEDEAQGADEEEDAEDEEEEKDGRPPGERLEGYGQLKEQLRSESREERRREAQKQAEEEAEGDGVPEEAEDAEDEGDEDAQEEAEDAEEAEDEAQGADEEEAEEAEEPAEPKISVFDLAQDLNESLLDLIEVLDTEFETRISDPDDMVPPDLEREIRSYYSADGTAAGGEGSASDSPEEDAADEGQPEAAGVDENGEVEDLGRFRVSVLQDLDPDPLERLVRQSSVHELEEGEQLFDQGDEDSDAFYLVLEGSIDIEKELRNEVETVNVMEPGEIFGEYGLSTNKPRQAAARAGEESEVLKVSRSALDQLQAYDARAHVVLYESMLEVLAHRFQTYAEKVEDGDELNELFS